MSRMGRTPVASAAANGRKDTRATRKAAEEAAAAQSSKKITSFFGKGEAVTRTAAAAEKKRDDVGAEHALKPSEWNKKKSAASSSGKAASSDHERKSRKRKPNAKKESSDDERDEAEQKPSTSNTRRKQSDDDNGAGSQKSQSSDTKFMNNDATAVKGLRSRGKRTAVQRSDNFEDTTKRKQRDSEVTPPAPQLYDDDDDRLLERDYIGGRRSRQQSSYRPLSVQELRKKKASSTTEAPTTSDPAEDVENGNFGVDFTRIMQSAQQAIGAADGVMLGKYTSQAEDAAPSRSNDSGLDMCSSAMADALHYGDFSPEDYWFGYKHWVMGSCYNDKDARDKFLTSKMGALVVEAFKLNGASWNKKFNEAVKLSNTMIKEFISVQFEPKQATLKWLIEMYEDKDALRETPFGALVVDEAEAEEANDRSAAAFCNSPTHSRVED
eukprot:jgi/Chlat1/4778/Chrsp308S00824